MQHVLAFLVLGVVAFALAWMLVDWVDGSVTTFQILCRTKEGWKTNGIEEAHNAEAAVKASYLKRPDPAILEMVAVPGRSWKPTKIRTETVTKIVLGEQPEPSVEQKPEPETKP